MGRAQGGSGQGTPSASLRSEAPVAGEQADAFAAVMGAGRGGGLKASTEDALGPVRFLVLDALRHNQGQDLELNIADGDRWLAVCIYDDDSAPYRHVQSWPTREGAVECLEAPRGDDYIGEYLIDLESSDRNDCCWQWIEDTKEVGHVVPFTPDNIVFAE